jgi:hypothetical protein
LLLYVTNVQKSPPRNHLQSFYLAKVLTSQSRAVHNANDLDMENRGGGAGNTNRGVSESEEEIILSSDYHELTGAQRQYFNSIRSEEHGVFKLESKTCRLHQVHFKG